MKKKIALQNDKLSFGKEKIANLTGEELDKVEGGVNEAPVGDLSTHHNFTCSACTTLSGFQEA